MIQRVVQHEPTFPAVTRQCRGRAHACVPSERCLALNRAAEGTPWAIPMVLGTTTGARRGEVLGLRWSDVDLDRGRIRITESLQRVDGRLTLVEPKTDRARREIALPSFVVERLRRHRADQAGRRLQFGDQWHDMNLVCEHGDGRPLDPDAWTKAFRRLARKAGLSPRVRLHDVRHGVATALLGEGVHPAIASAVLGHSSPAFTMATYQHVLDGMTDQAANALETAFGRAG